MSQQGSPLTLEQKKAIVDLKQYFERTKNDAEEQTLSTVTKVAHAFNLGIATVKRVLADYNRNPNFTPSSKERGRPNRVVHEQNQSIVRQYIRQANLQGQHITVDLIYQYLVEIQGDQEYSTRSLGRALDRWGFCFGKGIRSSNLKEKDYVVSARRRYLREKIANRNGHIKTHRPEVYLDESYVNRNHSNDFIWYLDEDGASVQKPTGKGERLIIVNAITAEGWVPNAKLVFKSSKKTGDYHGQMNHDIFVKWFEEQLLPNIPKNALIIMDNAPYHNVLAVSSAPTKNCKKQAIKKWLLANGVPVAENSLKAELIDLLQKMAPAPTYAIDEIAKKYGHEILRTPQYHPELQPIELCWGIVKNTVANKCDFTMKGLEKQLAFGFEKVTKETCLKIIHKVRSLEDAFWREDEILYDDDKDEAK